MRVGFLQDGVERGDDRNAQIAQQREDEAARRAAINSVFVLEADDVGVAEVQVVGRAPVGIEIVFAELEPHFVGIFVAFGQIVDGSDKTFDVGILLGHGVAQIAGERGDAALARKIIAEEGDLFNFSDLVRHNCID